jgi:hypothetical protein
MLTTLSFSKVAVKYTKEDANEEEEEGGEDLTN